MVLHIWEAYNEDYQNMFLKPLKYLESFEINKELLPTVYAKNFRNSQDFEYLSLWNILKVPLLQTPTYKRHTMRK